MDPTYNPNGSFKPTAKRNADRNGPDFSLLLHGPRFGACARAHVRVRESPFLLQPTRADETLYLYKGLDLSDGPWTTKYRVSLGPDQWPAPPPPTWREHLKSLGYRFERQEGYDRVYR